MVALLLVSQCLCDDWSAPCNRTRCTCKWMNGKKSALCNSADHSHIPTTLSTDLQVLSLNDNNIGYLNREEFFQNGLEHLQRIYVRNSGVRHVHREAFKNLNILVEIDLSENVIEALDPGTFSGNERLRILYLYGNPLKQLVANQFPQLPHLRTLDLHGCVIERVDGTAFIRLEQLEFLSLKNNSIATLAPNIFSHMALLKTLQLDENPWNCDCKLRPFRNWYVNTNYPMLLCVAPVHLSSVHWDSLREDQLGCSPTVELSVDHNNNNAVDLTGQMMKVSFHCLVSGDPVPQIAWELNGNSVGEGFNVEVVQGESKGDSLWSNLTIHNVSNFDSGIYSCRAWNSAGESEMNATLFLPEVVEHVIVKTHETFWYFGLIVGTFGTVFALLLVSVTFCFCRKASLQRRARRNQRKKKQQQHQLSVVGGGMNGNGNGGETSRVSFTEQEKKLLDLSLTNDRLDSCEMLVNTPSTTVTLNNSISMSAAAPPPPAAAAVVQPRATTASCSSSSAILPPPPTMQIMVEREGVGVSEEFPLNVSLFPPPPAEFSCTINSEGGGRGGCRRGNEERLPGDDCDAHLYSPAVVVTTTPGECGARVTSHPSNQYNMATVSAGPLCPSLNCQGAGSGGYGNIFISVSVPQEGAGEDNPDVNMFPDLLNIPNRIKTPTAGAVNKLSELAVDASKTSSAMTCNQNNNQRTVSVGVESHQREQHQPVHYQRGNVQSAYYTDLQPLVSYSSFHHPHPHHEDSGNYRCAFATLPRQLLTRIQVTGPPEGSPSGAGCKAIKFKDRPAPIPENHDEVIACHNLDASGATLRRPLRCASQFYGGSSSSSSSPQSRLRGEAPAASSVIVLCPSNYDNVGRRVTAGGNSAIKVSGPVQDARDDETVVEAVEGSLVTQLPSTT